MDALTGKLWRYVRPGVGSKDDAEDVIQEAYLRVVRYSVDHGVEDMERLLFSAAKNLAVDQQPQAAHARQDCDQLRRARGGHASLVGAR
jgi:DNA-directed RNA polymerase specialized sigma24 family protein